jgi:hypothetical protein
MRHNEDPDATSTRISVVRSFTGASIQIAVTPIAVAVASETQSALGSGELT